ncbi:zeta toxin family protein [Raoultibacter phocaeensis]|uniref:zeta toxin family protein n=1 Tax=Raoultibacter phocaeensis TaxID=2479841 RepID=UPI00111945BC|nr:zeta toxin family protein [Raoultibacter phocaeensis]
MAPEPATTKLYTLFAGINGAGKSTLFRSNLWSSTLDVKSMPRVNSDEILKEQGGDWSNPHDQMEAGRAAIGLLRTYLDQGMSFNQETTLTGRSIIMRIKRAHALGYRIVMYYVGVENPEIAQNRIARRIEVGGHGIDPLVVAKRAVTSLENLVEIAPICDEIYLFDNTYLLTLVARLEQGDLVQYDCGNLCITWPDALMRKLIAQMA